MLTVIETDIPGLLILEPQVFGDSRGFFVESWNQRAFNAAVGQEVTFVQDNHSRSARGVLRGLHFQREQTQGKLVRVTHGRVFDVAVDVRAGSLTAGQHVAVELSGDSQRQFWIPPGFAHGFLVLSESADFLYKTTDYYHPHSDQSLLWNDPVLNINWPLGDIMPQLSAKDIAGKPFSDITLLQGYA